jgi:RNA polymerase primary sigma factor
VVGRPEGRSRAGDKWRSRASFFYFSPGRKREHVRSKRRRSRRRTCAIAPRHDPQQRRRASTAQGRGSGTTARHGHGGEGHAVGAPLPGSRERQLIAASDRGDADATEALVEAFLPAIDSVARIYRGFSSLEQAEFRQEGVVGLLRAAKRYDQARGTPFWAYASWWVRQAMQQLVSELVGPVVLSDRAARRLVRVKRARSEYQQSNGREPSLRDLTAATGFPREQVEDLIAIERAPRRLDERPAEDGDPPPTFGESLADPQAEDAFERVDDLIEGQHMRDLGGDLDERERGIVFAHYGIGTPERTLREIAGGLHLSVERVRQLEERAFGKLREASLAGR